MRSASPKSKEHHARFVLSVLLGEAAGGGAGAAVPGVIDWDFLTRLAERNAVLIRFSEGLAELGLDPPLGFRQAVERERRRATAAVHVLARIRAAGVRHGIEWLLPKALQRFPDVGDDLDLLVLARRADIDHLLLEGLPVAAHPPTLAQRLMGSTVYTVTGSDLVLDIRHGRLGSAGQHAGYSAVLFQNRRAAAIGRTQFFVPSREDELVVQGMEKVTGRRSLDLCDVVYTVLTVRDGDLDWDYVTYTARAHGVEHGLRRYLHYVDEIHERLTGRELLPIETRAAMGRRGRLHARFAKASFRFPALWLTGRIHARQLALAAGRRDWPAVARLTLWPFAAIGARLKRFTARGRRPGPFSQPVP